MWRLKYVASYLISSLRTFPPQYYCYSYSLTYILQFLYYFDMVSFASQISLFKLVFVC